MVTHLLTIPDPFSRRAQGLTQVSLEMVLIDLLNLGAANLEGAVRVTEVTQSEEACSTPVLFTKTDVKESFLSISCKTKLTAGESG